MSSAGSSTPGISASPLTTPARVPLRLTVREFAQLTRVCEKTVQRDIRARIIEARGRPYLIPRRELEKFGVIWSEVTEADFPGAS
jgi:Helix-turn-helix domain